LSATLEVMAMRRSPRRTREAPPVAAADHALLGRVPYFRSLSAAQRRRVAERCRARLLAPGATLFEEGTPCAGLFIVATGLVEVRQVSLQGREQVFHTEGPGATLGEAPLFDRGAYIASAVALETTRVLFLPRGDLLELCRRHPDVALAILEALARRVRRFAEIIGDLAFRPVRARLAHYLHDAATARPDTAVLAVDLELTHAQLAARLGTVRELVARALAQLERAGAIRRAGKRIVIPDPARLEALAAGEAGGERAFSA
jgi:CRP-like cAMP-binding protein